MSKEIEPRFVFTCQHGDAEYRLLPAAEEHAEKMNHHEWFMHINGVKKNV